MAHCHRWQVNNSTMLDENKQKKTCRYCAETVPAAAKICPRCRQWLTYFSFRNPLVWSFCTVLPLVACVYICYCHITNRISAIINPAPHYSDFPGSLRVLQSRMQWVEETDGARLFITGMMTNQSSVSWKEIEFETRFYSANGNMIDAGNSYTRFTILPGNDSAFRVSVKPLLSSNDYSSFKISVSSARSTRGIY